MNARTLPEFDTDGATEERLDRVRDLITGPVRQSVRAHAPLPFLVRTIDLGEFGEHQAEVEYDGRRDSDAAGAFEEFHITAIRVRGVDLFPAFDAATIREYESVIVAALEAEARAARWEGM